MAVLIGGAIMAGISMIGGMNKAKSENKQAQKDYINQLNGNIAYNQTVKEQNLRNTIRTGYRVGLLNVQRGQSKRNATYQGFSISQQGNAALSQAEANAAAASGIGSSVNATLTDIQQKVDKAQAQVDEDYDIASQNFDVQLNDLIQQGMDTLAEPRSMDYSGSPQQDVLMAGVAAGVSSAVQSAGSYYGSKMNLGLGTPSTSGGVTGSGLQTYNVGGQFGYTPTSIEGLRK